MKRTYNGSVGIPELGERHNHLFERFVLVKDTLVDGVSWNDMHSALAMLIKDLEFCFALEEALMRIHDYPECERHMEEHAELLQSVRVMEKAALTNGLTDKMIGTAFAATMKHHLVQDRRYARSLPRVMARQYALTPASH